VATFAALAIGVGLRIWRPDLAQTNFDESNVASLVAAWKVQGAFPLAGTVSSYGFRAGEGWPWFAAVGLLPTDDPYGLIGVGLLAGIGGLLATWWVARRWLGPWGGATAALVHGTMFYCVLLERGAWLPVLLQAPLILCLDALLRVLVDRRAWALVVACGWFGILVSLHYTTVAYGPVIVGLAWYRRATLRPIHVVAAVCAVLLPLLPYLMYEVNPTVRFSEIRALLALSQNPSTLDLETITSTIQIATTQGALGLGGHASAEILARLGRWTTLTLLLPVLAAAGLVTAVLIRPKGGMGLLLVAWTLAPIVAYLRHSAPIIFHYMYLEFPALALCAAVLASAAAASSSRFLKLLVSVPLVAGCAASALSIVVVLHSLDDFDLSAGYGVPVGYSRAAGEAARNLLQSGGVVLIGDDPHSGEVLRYAVGYRIPSRTFEDCAQVPTVSNAVYLLSSERTPGAKALEAAGAPLLARIARPGDAFRIYGPPVASVQVQADPANTLCQDRLVWDAAGD
jgi:hypothetical protein